MIAGSEDQQLSADDLGKWWLKQLVDVMRPEMCQAPLLNPADLSRQVIYHGVPGIG